MIEEYQSQLEDQKVIPPYVPYAKIKAAFGEDTDNILEELVSRGEIVRHETLNSCSYSIK